MNNASHLIAALSDRATVLGLSSQEWADRAGMKRQQLQAYLSGKVDPRLKTAESLAEAVGMRIDLVNIYIERELKMESIG